MTQMSKENKRKTSIAKEIMDEYKAFENDEEGYSRNQIRVLDMFVAACLHFLGEMSNAKIAKICIENLNTSRKYTSDNVFQSRKRHKELTDTQSTRYNAHYSKTFERVVLSKSENEVLILLPNSL